MSRKSVVRIVCIAHVICLGVYVHCTHIFHLSLVEIETFVKSDEISEEFESYIRVESLCSIHVT